MVASRAAGPDGRPAPRRCTLRRRDAQRTQRQEALPRPCPPPQSEPAHTLHASAAGAPARRLPPPPHHKPASLLAPLTSFPNYASPLAAAAARRSCAALSVPTPPPPPCLAPHGCKHPEPRVTARPHAPPRLSPPVHGTPAVMPPIVRAFMRSALLCTVSLLATDPPPAIYPVVSEPRPPRRAAAQTRGRAGAAGAPHPAAAPVPAFHPPLPLSPPPAAITCLYSPSASRRAPAIDTPVSAP